ncbi:conserved hypothetical protein [Treponema primitia ZAS-2]|uniref:TIR domain-containing protein n=1 Tax=Treponema primitia (strain ATCC BAA-887 / DSM 12427 / ZAS-2) TaxID=545694 RepID=F5YM90_TREPZ|nr:hypothetical protein [Treponema primitia]AEF84885.1 conserved hypothetical protein [Treponema primitia ZAS-2]
MFKPKVFISSCQYNDEFIVERQLLPILFDKEPLRSIFELWEIEQQAAGITVEAQYIRNIRQSEYVILLLDSIVRDAVKKEIEEARKNNIFIFPFIRINKNRSIEATAYIKYLQDFCTTVFYSDVKDLSKKIEYSLLAIYSQGDKKVQNIYSKLNTIKPQHDKSIFIATIIGSWDDTNADDINIIKEMTGENFTEWESDIHEVINYTSDILKVNNGRWKVLNRSLLFEKYALSFFDKHIEKIKNIADIVLSERHPMFDLAPEKRISYFYYGAMPKYSDELRIGIAETLVYLNLNADKLEHCTPYNSKKTVNSIIKELFDKKDWKTWASLRNLLPVLAEASPRVFMEVIENAINQLPCPFIGLFPRKDKIILGPNYLSDLYWALEALSWSGEYITQAILILAYLANIDPGGDWPNTPLKSIETILNPWRPQTTADMAKRMNAMKGILKRCPEVAFAVLLRLLPSFGQIGNNSRKPVYRKHIPENFENNVSKEEYSKQINEFGIMLLELVKQDDKRIMVIAELLDNSIKLPGDALNAYLDYLLSDEIISKPDEFKQPICDTLRLLVIKHRKFSKSHWALKSEIIDKIDIITDKISPHNPLYSYRYLFSDNVYSYFDEDIEFDDKDKKIDSLKVKAIGEIFNYGGLKAIENFAKSIANPYFVGFSFSAIISNETQQAILPASFNHPEKEFQEFLKGLINGKYYKYGELWFEDMDILSWNIKNICKIFISLPFNEKTWALVEKWMGVSARDYWLEVNCYIFSTISDLTIAVNNFLKVNRPWLALECIYAHHFNNECFLADQALKALLTASDNGLQRNDNRVYKLKKIIELLQKDNSIKEDDMIKIEWKYLQFFNEYDQNIMPKHIYKKMSANPDYFLEMIKFSFISDINTKKEATENINIINNREKVWHLFRNWIQVPGIISDGSFSLDNFKKWFADVERKSNELGYYQEAMVQIGGVLFYTPSDTNGLWINEYIAELLDKNSNLRQGYVSESYNPKRVHTIDLSENDETETAIMWRKRAADIENIGYITFCLLVNEIAEFYEYRSTRNRVD